MDSTRWDHVKLRDDDIIVATFGKTGTTLTQQMCAQLILGAPDGVGGLGESPWVDVRWGPPIEKLASILEAQTHRRFMKTHLPFDGLGYSPKVKYIYIARDARDVVWSLYNHHASFSEAALKDINAAEGPWEKVALPKGDARAYYLHWLETDQAQGTDDMVPSYWNHVQGWWDERHRPNILLLHYANIIADLPRALRSLAAFLDVSIDEAKFPAMVEHCSIDYMREQAIKSQPMSARFAHMFKDGAANFFNKGTNGRWRDVLSPEEIARCDELAARRLAPDCTHWLKTGELPVRRNDSADNLATAGRR